MCKESAPVAMSTLSIVLESYAPNAFTPLSVFGLLWDQPARAERPMANIAKKNAFVVMSAVKTEKILRMFTNFWTYIVTFRLAVFE